MSQKVCVVNLVLSYDDKPQSIHSDSFCTWKLGQGMARGNVKKQAKDRMLAGMKIDP
jgi:hypothetical protein